MGLNSTPVTSTLIVPPVTSPMGQKSFAELPLPRVSPPSAQTRPARNATASPQSDTHRERPRWIAGGGVHGGKTARTAGGKGAAGSQKEEPPRRPTASRVVCGDLDRTFPHAAARSRTHS